MTTVPSSTRTIHQHQVVATKNRFHCTEYQVGTIDYVLGWELQKVLVHQRAEEEIGDTLLLVEHPHVYTVGRRISIADVLASSSSLTESNIPIIEVDRGGETTYHGPGQLVGYTIFGIRQFGGPLQFVRQLEDVLVAVIRRLDLDAVVVPGKTGVWIKQKGDIRKIASIGLRISRGITSHGFALNVNTDLQFFDQIIPCGLEDCTMTSLEQELGYKVDLPSVIQYLEEEMANVMSLRVEKGNIEMIAPQLKLAETRRFAIR
mgnify:FL=1